MIEMTFNILENISKKSSTRLYPFTKREDFARARGELYCDIDECIFCGTCARKCPSLCITVDKKAQTWECDVMKCVWCGNCVDSCPVSCLHQKTSYRPVTTTRDKLFYKSDKPIPKPKKVAKAEE